MGIMRDMKINLTKQNVKFQQATREELQEAMNRGVYQKIIYIPPFSFKGDLEYIQELDTKFSYTRVSLACYKQMLRRLIEQRTPKQEELDDGVVSTALSD